MFPSIASPATNTATLACCLLVVPQAMAFNIFEQMFSGGGGGAPQQPQNAPSDSNAYQRNYDGSESLRSILQHAVADLVQLTATNTFVRARCLACTFLTTVLAHSRPLKIRWSLEMESLFVRVEGVLRKEKWRGRLSLRGKGFCKLDAMHKIHGTPLPFLVAFASSDCARSSAYL